MHVYIAHTIIEAPADRVFEYASDPENITKWSTGFMSDPRRTPKGYVVKTPLGDSPLEIFSDRRTGVIDNTVVGQRFPARVTSLGPTRSLYAFTLLLPPGMPESEVEKGKEGMDEELRLLKRQVEALGKGKA